MKEKRKSKSGRNPKLDPAVYRYTVRFNEEEHNRCLLYTSGGRCRAEADTYPLVDTDHVEDDEQDEESQQTPFASRLRLISRPRA